VHTSELDQRVSWQGDGARRALILRRGRVVGAYGVGAWPDAGRMVGAVTVGARAWPWQIAQFRRSGGLWPEATPLAALTAPVRLARR